MLTSSPSSPRPSTPASQVKYQLAPLSGTGNISNKFIDLHFPQRNTGISEIKSWRKELFLYRVICNQHSLGGVNKLQDLHIGAFKFFFFNAAPFNYCRRSVRTYIEQERIPCPIKQSFSKVNTERQQV